MHNGERREAGLPPFRLIRSNNPSSLSHWFVLPTVFTLAEAQSCAFNAALVHRPGGSAPTVSTQLLPIIAVLALKRRGSWVVSHHLTVSGRGPLHSRIGGADARVTAGGPGPAAVDINVYQVAVEDGPVGRGSDRGAAQLQLLLWVSQLQRAGALIGGQLLAIRPADGGGQVDVLLQVGISGLEAAETVPLHNAGRV